VTPTRLVRVVQQPGLYSQTPRNSRQTSFVFHLFLSTLQWLPKRLSRVAKYMAMCAHFNVLSAMGCFCLGCRFPVCLDNIAPPFAGGFKVLPEEAPGGVFGGGRHALAMSVSQKWLAVAARRLGGGFQ
jgi:hypothetical protein